MHDLYETEGLQITHLSEATSDGISTTGKALQQGYERVADRARTGYQQTAHVIAKRPTESVVAALAVGLV